MKKGARAQGDLVWGLHAVDRLLERSPERLRRVSVLAGRRDRRLAELLERIEPLAIPVEEVPRQTLDRLAAGGAHQGIVAGFLGRDPLPEGALTELLEGANGPPLLLVLDGVQDPHNLGACLRTADAAGVHAVIAPKDNAVGLTPTVCKVASGAAEAVPYVQVTNLARVMDGLKQQGVWMIGTAGEAESDLFQTDLAGPLGLVMGGEGKGLRRLTRERCDLLVHLPMFGTVESLNVSVATGICLYEAVRQRLPSERSRPRG